MKRTLVSDELEKFFGEGESLRVGKGEVIYDSDQEPSSVFLLEEGYVKSYTITPDGSLNVVSLYGPGFIFPLGPALRSQDDKLSFHFRDTIYFEAMSPVKVLKRTVRSLHETVEIKPVLYKELAARLINNYELYLSRVEGSQFRRARERVIYQLLVLASRFGTEKNGKVYIKIPLTQQDLADSLYMARETVSRELELLRQAGLIKNNAQKCIVIQDIEKLESEL